MPESTLNKPARSQQPQSESPEEEMSRTFTHWANKQPDEDLLERLFVQCVLEDWDVAAALSETEERWVLANLEVNPSWKKRWKELETEIGQSVEPQGVDQFTFNQIVGLNVEIKNLTERLKSALDRLDQMDEVLGAENE